MDSNMQFPLVELSLNQGETVFIQRGSMVYHTPNVTLNTQLNASGSGLGRFVKAVGRSMVSGESTFITQAVAQSDNGYLALAPDAPGQVIPLQLGEKQYRLNDGAFLALDGTAYYTMERQSVGKALFGGQGGFFVMTTQGQGTLLANAFVWLLVAPIGDILIYSEPVNKVFVQGFVATLSNGVTVAVAGTLLLLAYARTQTRSGSLKKD